MTSYSNLEEAFQKVYQELKSFYYLEFCSPNTNTTSEDIDLSVKQWNAKAPFFRL